MNQICGIHVCHVNFGCMSRLEKLNLIPSFTTVMGSKCQVCVQAKQPRKSQVTAETRNLVPLDLIHSDLCEMNGVLIKGGTKYFMTLIDDSTRYCHVYLLKSKDDALIFFSRSIKLKWKTNLIGKSRGLGPTVVESIFPMSLMLFVRNMV